MYNKELLDKLKNELKSNYKENEGDKRMCFLPLKKSDQPLKIRVLPSIYNGQEVPGIIFKKHKNIPEHKGINCLTMYDQKCPICEMLNKYRSKTNVEEFEAASKSALNVLILNDNAKNPTDPYILIGTKKLLSDIIEFYFNTEIGDVTDIKTGVALTISREFDYGKLIITYARVGTPIADNDKKIQEILNNRYDLSETWKSPSQEYIQTVIECSTSIENEIKNRLKTTETIEATLDLNLDIEKPKQTETPSARENKNVVPKTETLLPECFMNHEEDADKCNLCMFEFQCIEKTPGK